MFHEVAARNTPLPEVDNKLVTVSVPEELVKLPPLRTLRLVRLMLVFRLMGCATNTIVFEVGTQLQLAPVLLMALQLPVEFQFPFPPAME